MKPIFHFASPLDHLPNHARIPFPIGAVAQLVRVPACRAGCCGFESRPPRFMEQTRPTARQWVLSIRTCEMYGSDVYGTNPLFAFEPVGADRSIGDNRDIKRHRRFHDVYQQIANRVGFVFWCFYNKFIMNLEYQASTRMRITK